MPGAAGTTHTYTAADLCGSPANSTGYVAPGSFHNVTLANLTASTHYFYRFGDPVRATMLLHPRPRLASKQTALYIALRKPSCAGMSWQMHKLQCSLQPHETPINLLGLGGVRLVLHALL